LLEKDGRKPAALERVRCGAGSRVCGFKGNETMAGNAKMAGNRTGVAGRKSDPDRGGVVPFKSELSALKEFLSAVLSAASRKTS